MSAILRTYLRCDGADLSSKGCSATFGTETRGRNAAWLRVSARAEGWRRKGGLDVCPACLAVRVERGRKGRAKKP